MNNRTKIAGVAVLITLSIAAIFSVVLGFSKKPAAYSKALFNDVHQLLKITSLPAFNLVEQRSISRQLNKTPSGMNSIARWIFKLEHPNVEHDVDIYLYTDGSNTITATVFHDDKSMLDIKIRSSPSRLKEADDLKTAIRNRFPDLPCD